MAVGFPREIHRQKQQRQLDSFVDPRKKKIWQFNTLGDPAI
jgi:hypothetical protein